MTDEIHSCSYYCDRPACIKAQRDELVRKYVETKEKAEPVAVAGSMPGTSGFTMAVFEASRVPIGTSIYTDPPAERVRVPEVAWLIEKWDAKRDELKAEWFALGDFPQYSEDGWAWTKDSTVALRFAREQDAQAYIDDIGWIDARPTEHAWLSASPEADHHD